MPRYVVVEFDDDASAQRLVDQISARTARGDGMRIAGLYARPTKWCTCPFHLLGVKREVVRGKKYGWWMCTTCKRVRPGTHQLENIHPRMPWPFTHDDAWQAPTEPRWDYLVTGINIAEVPF